MRRFLIALATASLAALIPTASAAVVGHLDTANCAGGGVIVTLTTIDWTLPVGGGFGCIQTGQNTNITYTTGTLGPSTPGQILDLVAGPPATIPDFMTFSGNPNLHFDLTQLGPGVTNTSCATVLNPNLPACSVVANSPFILAPTSTGTSVSLSAMGIARDLSGPNASWSGAFTTQIAGQTPAQIQSTIVGGGSVSSTHSGDFVVTVVPEPSTLTMLFAGAVAVFLGKRKVRA